MGTIREQIERMHDEILINVAKSTYNMIYRLNCFNKQDLLLLDMCENELRKRGYEVEESPELIVSREE